VLPAEVAAAAVPDSSGLPVLLPHASLVAVPCAGEGIDTAHTRQQEKARVNIKYLSSGGAAHSNKYIPCNTVLRSDKLLDLQV
jgi:hypothetical protein